MKQSKKTLGVFTVKKLSLYNGIYYTYGGFGLSFNEIRKYFSKTILVAHVKHEPPGKGYYAIDLQDSTLKVVELLQSRNELENLIQLPYNFIKSLFAAKEMDVVHARMPDYTGIIGALVCKIFNIPYFVQTVADWEIEGKKVPITKKYGLGLFLKMDYYFYDVLERIVCKNQLVFCQGETSFRKHKQQSEAYLVYSSAHYISDLKFAVKALHTNKIRILNIARLTGIKNQKLILKALQLLKTENPEIQWELNIVGTGPLFSSLQDLAKQYAIDQHVNFIGQLDRGDSFWEFLDTSDMFILSSRSEGTPKVILESMARSLPVIASNVGGIPDMVDHGNRGLLFEDDDPKDLKSKIVMLLNNEDERERIVNNGFKFAEMNTIENAVGFITKTVFTKWPSLIQ